MTVSSSHACIHQFKHLSKALLTSLMKDEIIIIIRLNLILSHILDRNPSNPSLLLQIIAWMKLTPVAVVQILINTAHLAYKSQKYIFKLFKGRFLWSQCQQLWLETAYQPSQHICHSLEAVFGICRHLQTQTKCKCINQNLCSKSSASLTCLECELGY